MPSTSSGSPAGLSQKPPAGWLRWPRIALPLLRVSTSQQLYLHLNLIDIALLSAMANSKLQTFCKTSDEMFFILGVDLDFSQLSAHQSKTLEMETQVSKNLFFLQFMVSFVPHLIHKLWTKTPFHTPFHKENDINICPFENRQWKREQVTFNCMNYIIQFFSANAIQLQTIHCYQCLLFSKGDVNKQQSCEHVLGI